MASEQQGRTCSSTPLSNRCGRFVSPVCHKMLLITPEVPHVESFLPERFIFVAVPGAAAHNNLAERRGRPLVLLTPSAEKLAVPKDRKRVQVWLACLAPGAIKDSIHSLNAWFSSLSPTHWGKSEQLPI